MIIVFDSETRQFSAFDETREFGEKWNNFKTHVNKNSTVYAGIGGMLAGAGTGTIIARQKAKKQAAELGLKPGTPEYKKFVNRQGAKGAGIGAGAGLITGAGADIGIRRIIANKDAKKRAISFDKNNEWDKLDRKEKRRRIANYRTEPLIHASMFQRKKK